MNEREQKIERILQELHPQLRELLEAVVVLYHCIEAERGEREHPKKRGQTREAPVWRCDRHEGEHPWPDDETV
jgi:hypothetical protein